jgi:succinate dehydrogenase/fumarate reductase cytochrome b subunit
MQFVLPTEITLPARETRIVELNSRALRLAPVLVSLIYPVLVWCVSAVSPFALLLTLAPALVCLYVISVLAKTTGYRGAYLVAHFGIGSAALYSAMGGWLDFQKTLPFHANSAWIVLWCGLGLYVAFERSGPTQMTVSGSNRRLAFAHGLSATVILLFATFHLSNHLAGLAGGDVHMAVMNSLRKVYRQPVVELILAGCILFQNISGVLLLIRRPRPNSGIEVLQGASGAYMMLFFTSHIGAVIRARYLRHTETNWAWLTGSNLLTDLWSSRLVPYYFLGVIALSVHAACGLRRILLEHGRPDAARWTFRIVATVGSLASTAIIIGVVRGSLGSH